MVEQAERRDLLDDQQAHRPRALDYLPAKARATELSVLSCFGCFRSHSHDNADNARNAIKDVNLVARVDGQVDSTKTTGVVVR